MANQLAAPRTGNGNGQNRQTNHSGQMPWQIPGLNIEERAQAAIQWVFQISGSGNFRGQVRKALPPRQQHEKAVDFFVSGVRSAVRKNPDLILKCRHDTLWQAVLEAAERGVRLDNGEGWLVPYKSAVQFQIGWKGAVKNARAAGVIMLDAQPVYENDPCTIRLGTDPTIEHEPYLDGDRGKLRGVYAWVKLTADEPPMIEWMSVEQIDKIRKSGPSANSPAWGAWFDEMGRAKVLKRLAKRVPAKDEMDLAAYLEDGDEKTIEGESEQIFGVGGQDESEQPVSDQPAQAPQDQVEDKREQPIDTKADDQEPEKEPGKMRKKRDTRELDFT